MLLPFNNIRDLVSKLNHIETGMTKCHAHSLNITFLGSHLAAAAIALSKRHLASSDYSVFNGG